MDRERWQQVKQILEDAIEVPTEDRSQFVATACGDDAELMTEVDSLLSESIAAEVLESNALDHVQPVEDKLLNTQIGKYRLTELIGTGGMGRVYLAERADGAFEQKVALKLIRRGLDSEEILRRFVTERQILASLVHPNIAHLIDGGTTADGLPFLVMEYVEGLKSVSVTVLDYAPKPEAPKEISQGRSYRPQVGDSERWVFLVDGKEIGEQTARCVKTDVEGGRAYSDWTYNLTIEAGGQKVAMLGGYSVWEDGTPRKLTFDADVAGTHQTGQYVFTGDKVDAQIKVGETPVSRSIPMQKGVLLQMNNLLSLFSITMRSIPLEAGQTRTVPFFAAGTMQKVDLTFRCGPEPRKLTVMGKDRSCIVCDVDPIQNRFFLDASSGELLRIEVPAGRLVIERR